MWVESIPGQGSTFRFAVHCYLFNLPATNPACGDAPLQSLRILIIERNACVRTLLVATSRLGHAKRPKFRLSRLGLTWWRDENHFDIIAVEACNSVRR